MFFVKWKLIIKIVIIVFLLQTPFDLFPVNNVLAQTYPDPPQHLTSKTVIRNVNLIWETPLKDGGSPITGYKVEYALAIHRGGDGKWHTLVDLGVVATYTHMDVNAFYAYRVSAVNAYGISFPSNHVGDTTTFFSSVSAPPWIDPFTVTVKSATELTLTWGPAARDNGLPILGYRIEYWPRSHKEQLQEIVTQTPDVFTLDIGGLQTNILYDLHVAAYNRVGVGDYSESKQGIPKDPDKARVEFKVYEGNTMIVGAEVRVEGQTLMTNAAGKVTSDLLPVGKRTFSVSINGYELYNGEVTLFAGDGIRPVNVPLIRSVSGLIPTKLELKTDYVSNECEVIFTMTPPIPVEVTYVRRYKEDIRLGRYPEPKRVELDSNGKYVLKFSVTRAEDSGTIMAAFGGNSIYADCISNKVDIYNRGVDESWVIPGYPLPSLVMGLIISLVILFVRKKSY